MKSARAAGGALLLLAALAGCGEKVTAAGLDFAAYGDCRHRRAIHQELCRSMAAASPKYVLVTGDLVDYADRPEQWAEWKADTEALRAQMKYHCAAGNHDLGEGNLFQKTLGIERLYFDVREGDAHIFILDSNQNFADPALRVPRARRPGGSVLPLRARGAAGPPRSGSAPGALRSL